jgi:hypothetical protein
VADFSQQIRIGPEFFAKVKNDYACWKWAVAREFIQNGLDARGTRNINVLISHEDGMITLSVANDGQAMTEHIITQKLLPLGASSKDDEPGSVGGMGAAKLVIYFTHADYEIRSGKWLVTGSGAGYDLEEQSEHHHGTHSVVHIPGDESLMRELISAFNSCIEQCQRPNVTFTVNGVDVKGNLKKGARRRQFDWGVVYTNKTHTNRLIVRIGGIPMFTRYVDTDDRCVVVELKGRSTKVLTTNRDGLRDEENRQLNEFVRQITVDKTSAFRDVYTTYTHFRGERLAATVGEAMKDIVAAAYATRPAAPAVSAEEQTERKTVDSPVTLQEAAKAEPMRIDSDDTHRVTNEIDVEPWQVEKRSKVKHDFVIKNNLGMQVPAHFSPYDFSEYSRRLVRCWTAVLLEVHRQFNDTQDFTVGFLFDDTAEAEFEVSPQYGRVFYINPAAVRMNDYSQSRSLAKRWKMNPEGRWMMVANAVHEYVHKARSWHDESYANKLTDRMAAVLWRRNDFNRCFREEK